MIFNYSDFYFRTGEGHRASRSPSPGRKSPLKSPNQKVQEERYNKDGDKYKHRYFFVNSFSRFSFLKFEIN